MRTIPALLASVIVASTGAAAFAQAGTAGTSAPVTKQEQKQATKHETLKQNTQSMKTTPTEVK